MPKLIVERGTNKGQIFAFDQEAIIGQGPGVPIQIDDKQMAPRHARIYQKKGRFFIEMLEGQTGVSVNGTIVTTRLPVLSGNKVRIGLTWFQFIEEGSGANSAVNILAILQYYEIIEGIDRGGLGNVCKVKELSLDRTVVLRIIPPNIVHDSEAEQKFQEVAQRMASLCHENISMFLDFGFVNKYIYYTMAWVEGVTLDEKIHTLGKIGHQQALKIALQIARGLSHAHTRRILHRDLNPKGIIVTNNENAVISDFGVAKFIMEITGSYPGLIEYYSPEQCENGELDPRSDIYSLGVVLYQMVIGSLPFESEDLDEIKKHHLSTVPKNVSELIPSISKEVSDIIMKCLAKDPEERFPNCEILIELIEKILDPMDEEKESRPSAVSSSQTTDFSQNPLFPWILTSIFSLLFGIALFLF
ncbi:MAG: FHA domain-containing serine/threonine-protein kinase [Planctomycetota bacterium]